MADKTSKQESEDTQVKAQNSKRILKKPETVRQRAEKAGVDKKPRRIKQARTTAAKPFKVVARTGRREYYLPLPDTKVGRFMNKKRHLIPSYFRLSWIELKQVKWPGRKETAKLTLAVFMFAFFLGILVTTVDYGLDKLFKQVILK